jgi:hypothetical protein
MEAAFSSQIITLFIYDASPLLATRIFEMFLVDGAQAIVDVIASMLELAEEELLKLEELDLMNYLRKEIFDHVFNKYPTTFVLSKSPNVFILDTLV